LQLEKIKIFSIQIFIGSKLWFSDRAPNAKNFTGIFHRPILCKIYGKKRAYTVRFPQT